MSNISSNASDDKRRYNACKVKLRVVSRYDTKHLVYIQCGWPIDLKKDECYLTLCNSIYPNGEHKELDTTYQTRSNTPTHRLLTNFKSCSWCIQPQTTYANYQTIVLNKVDMQTTSREASARGGMEGWGGERKRENYSYTARVLMEEILSDFIMVSIMDYYTPSTHYKLCQVLSIVQH